jgi:pimeloyl-ACP methyl ester carboxylesterase
VHARVAERMPRGWIQAADAGHLILMEKPGLVLEAIERLLRDVTEAR